ncbi:hypothetical protein JCM13304A_02920 [Desulfothermus okinawensis JCM 13304]
MIVSIIALLTLLILLPINSVSKMIKLTDGDMDRVVGQAGVTIGISNYKTYRNFEYIGYKDTDSPDGTNGTIFFNNIEILETLSTGNVDTNGDNLKTGVVIDVFQNPDSIPMVSFVADDFDHRFDFHAGSIDFCQKKIGSLDIDEIHPYSHRYYATGHSDGVDFQYNLGLEITNFDYKYQYNENNTPNHKSLHFDKFYMVKDFTTNPEDDPTDPSTWKPNGQFQFGDLNPYGGSTYNPGTLDVGVDPNTNLAQILINLPMEGSIRISNFQVGDTNFGPIAIDGIHVHRMHIRLIP